MHKPLAKSSSISKSFSFADMDKYRAVEYLFDCLADRTSRPSCDETVFWRDTGTNEDEDDVEALDTCGITLARDMMAGEFQCVDWTAKLGRSEGWDQRSGAPRLWSSVIRMCSVRLICIRLILLKAVNLEPSSLLPCGVTLPDQPCSTTFRPDLGSDGWGWVSILEDGTEFQHGFGCLQEVAQGTT